MSPEYVSELEEIAGQLRDIVSALKDIAGALDDPWVVRLHQDSIDAIGDLLEGRPYE